MNWYSIKAKSKEKAEISIMDEIGGWGISAQQFAKDLKNLGDLKHIDLHIHSPGGSVFDGIAIYNLLKNHPASKTVYIDGLAASMASVIAMLGDPVIMPKNAMMMIHKPWGIQGGDAEDMRKYADLLDKIENTLIPAYAEKTGKSPEELAEMLKEETWLTAEECVEQGFADKLAEPIKAMASITSQRMKEFKSMPNALKTLLEPKAQAKTTVEPQAVVSEPALTKEEPKAQAEQPKAQIPQADPLATLAERNAKIKATFANFGGRFDGLMAECLGDLTMSAEQAKDRLLAELGKDTQPLATTHIHVSNGNIVGDSMKAALIHRGGGEKAEKDNPYAGMILREMARASLVDRGVGLSGMNAMQIVGQAFTHSSSDFGSILLDVAHKSIIKGWQEHIEDFDKFTTKGTLTDFRPAHRVGMGSFDQLDLLPEGAEYTYATLTDTQTQIALATYGKAFSITRQAIINDDMGMLTKIPYKLGQAAKATIANLIFATITGNGKLADGKALLDKTRGNLLDNSAFGLNTLDKAIQMMNAHKSFDGKTQLLIEPDYLLVPTALHTRAKQILGSSSVEGAEANSGIINPLQNIVPIAKSQRLQAVSATDWYLINKEAIEVSYLDGVETPFIDQMEGFNTDGIATKVRIDAGVNVIDYRGLLKATA
ncbi:Clp protease ClpP [Glaesserella parasuis]|nr:Clp protease ClpP [Glaesserella parasuis]